MTTAKPLTVGLIGAGPWAGMVHAPMLAADPHTQLVGIWARRAEASQELASRHGAVAFDRVEALFDACDAVAFAVPPGVQADLALQAAMAGKALLLEKPLADSLEGAERLAAAIAEAGVMSMLCLTWRFSALVKQFLDDAGQLEPFGGRGTFVSGGLLGGPFATPWRLERGALLDLGPHVIDLLEAALGRVVGITAHGQILGWTGLLLDHEDGCTSEASLCATVPIEPHRAGVEIYGHQGSSSVDCVLAVEGATFATMAAEFAQTVRSGERHPLDAEHGLHLQRLLASAETDLL